MGSSDIERIRGRRTSLYRATLNLELAAAAPTGDIRRWCSRTGDAATELAACIEAHARETEQPGDFLDTIAREAPHLVNAAKQLESEHVELIERAHKLEVAVQGFDSGAEPLAAADAIRRDALELMGRLIRHRQRGADLIYLMYNEDLGG